MKMEPIVSSETSATKSQTPGNYPKRNKLHLQHGESLRTRLLIVYFSSILLCPMALFFGHLMAEYQYFRLQTKKNSKNN